MKKETGEKAALGARLRQRMRIQNEDRFYFILQLLFAATQILLAYVAFLGESLVQTGVYLIALFGILMMLMAGKGWQNRAVRALGRGLSAAVLVLFLVVIIGDVVTTKVSDSTGLGYITRPVADYWGQTLAYLCRLIQPLLLVLFPAFAIAARRVKKTADIRILQIGGWVLPLLAAGTLALSYEVGITRLTFSSELLGLDNRVLLIAYLICTLASVLSVFMAYPYGVKWLKGKIEKTRAKSTKTDEDTE